jgi:hypothetical protein
MAEDIDGMPVGSFRSEGIAHPTKTLIRFLCWSIEVQHLWVLLGIKLASQRGYAVN